MQSQIVKDLFARVRLLPAKSIWSQTRGAEHQLGLQCLSILLGGHVRAGLEDNLYIEPGVEAHGSAELIEKILIISKPLGRSAAKPSRARKILGLSF